MSEIQNKYNALLAGGLNLGSGATAELDTFDGGHKKRFQHGVIYHHKRVKAYEVHGLILQKYIELCEEESMLGYPVSDEEATPGQAGGRQSRFENGTILYHPTTGITVRQNAFVPPPPKISLKIYDHINVFIPPGQFLSFDQVANLAGQTQWEPAVQALKLIFPNQLLSGAFSSLSEAQLQQLINTAKENDPSYNPPKFSNYLLIECSAGIDADVAVEALKFWSSVVEWAFEKKIEDANVVGTSNPYFTNQDYLKPAPVGIGVQAAWNTGADGSNVRFIDIERAWLLCHEDLPQDIPLLKGIMRPDDWGHGTAVLGVVLAIDNNTGIVGITPSVNASVVSVFKTGMAAEILYACILLQPGDVILLEFTVGGRLPPEADADTFIAIELATRVGIIVIEVAGNGGIDLDTVRDHKNRLVHSRSSPDFKNSGAILVGACRSEVPHNRLDFSNFGSRIDCHAWGENVYTTGFQTREPRRNDYFNFGGTSAAAAIIAGVCIIIQDMQYRMGYNPLRADDMRNMLTNPSNGTPSFSVYDRIGIMPDLQKIVTNHFTY